jgi:pimeloyl-ACP methyl ester carboxylesterase
MLRFTIFVMGVHGAVLLAMLGLLSGRRWAAQLVPLMLGFTMISIGKSTFMPNDAWKAAYRLVRVGARLVAVLVGVVLLGAALYEHIGAWRDRRVLKQIGRSVDIGGRTLNIHCTGEGSPTVIFVSARTAPGYVWTPTQRGVSAFTRACWYDRADLGWSDAGPDPAWGDAAARDLHRLVQNAGLRPPLVLVGHSFGGYVIRLYHHAYPGEASGMVFVDTALEDAGTIPGMPHRERPPIPRAVILGLSTVLGRLGMIRFLASDPGPPPKHWSADEWNMLSRLRRQRNILLADAKVGPGRATDDLVRATGGLEEMPLIVLTQGNPSSPSSAAPGVLRGWVDLQRRFAQRSRRGRQVLVRDSGHGMPEEAPDAIISAVREIVTTVRSATAPTFALRAPADKPAGSLRLTCERRLVLRLAALAQDIRRVTGPPHF